MKGLSIAHDSTTAPLRFVVKCDVKKRKMRRLLDHLYSELSEILSEVLVVLDSLRLLNKLRNSEL
jgi:hypothetical protein